MNVYWVKTTTKEWCNLETINLENVDTFGVYIIWHGGQNARVVRVGQGNVKDRLTAHRKDREVLGYKQHGLFVTWAEVPSHQVDGVERHLAEKWNPLVGDRFPNVRSISVNSPWD
jgi:hypothetical protein